MKTSKLQYSNKNRKIHQTQRKLSKCSVQTNTNRTNTFISTNESKKHTSGNTKTKCSAYLNQYCHDSSKFGKPQDAATFNPIKFHVSKGFVPVVAPKLRAHNLTDNFIKKAKKNSRSMLVTDSLNQLSCSRIQKKRSPSTGSVRKIVITNKRKSKENFDSNKCKTPSTKSHAEKTDYIHQPSTFVHILSALISNNLPGNSKNNYEHLDSLRTLSMSLEDVPEESDSVYENSFVKPVKMFNSFKKTDTTFGSHKNSLLLRNTSKLILSKTKYEAEINNENTSKQSNLITNRRESSQDFVRPDEIRNNSLTVQVGSYTYLEHNSEIESKQIQKEKYFIEKKEVLSNRQICYTRITDGNLKDVKVTKEIICDKPFENNREILENLAVPEKRVSRTFLDSKCDRECQIINLPKDKERFGSNKKSVIRCQISVNIYNTTGKTNEYDIKHKIQEDKTTAEYLSRLERNLLNWRKVISLPCMRNKIQYHRSDTVKLNNKDDNRIILSKNSSSMSYNNFISIKNSNRQYDSTNGAKNKVVTLFIRKFHKQNKQKNKLSANEETKEKDFDIRKCMFSNKENFQDEFVDSSNIQNNITRSSENENNFLLKLPSAKLLLPKFSQILPDIEKRMEKKINRLLTNSRSNSRQIPLNENNVDKKLIFLYTRKLDSNSFSKQSTNCFS